MHINCFFILVAKIPKHSDYEHKTALIYRTKQNFELCATLWSFYVSNLILVSYPYSERLDPSDALFVDVIHSAGLWIGTDEVVSIYFKNKLIGNSSFDFTL